MRIQRFDRLFLYLCLSLMLNVIFMGCLIWLKREPLLREVRELISAKPPSSQLLSEFNADAGAMSSGVYGQGFPPKKTFKMLIVGNSISVHGVFEAVGWTDSFGMAASSKEKDYVHTLVRMLSDESKSQIEWLAINVAEFERGRQLDEHRLSKIRQFKPDIAVFQIGENVPVEFVNARFRDSYIDLIKLAQAKRNILCLPFWPHKDKSRAISDVALSTRAYLVDLSHLNGKIEPENLANSERNGLHPGVAAHPGDRGMTEIANRIFATARHLVE